MAWRTSPLPAEWPTIRRRIIMRDGGRCTETLANGQRCTGGATDVHHMGAPDDHRDAVLRSLCAWHHRRITSAQANAKRVRVTQRYPSEKHPGVR